MKKRSAILFILLVSAAMLLFTSTLQAATVVGTSSGTFLNPAGPSGMVVTGEGSDYFTWGTGDYSELLFAGSEISTELDQTFSFGTLRYYNGSIGSGTGADSVDLKVGINFSSPADIESSFTFDLGLINTPNTYNPWNSADKVSFSDSLSSFEFSADGNTYSFEFMGFGTPSWAGFITTDEFHVFEGQSASVELVGKISAVPAPAPVPLPASAWLLASGIIGFIGLRRKG